MSCVACINSIYENKKCEFLTYHSHFRKIQQSILRKVGRTLFNKRQIRQIHSQIWYTWWITTMQSFAHRTKSSIRANNSLQFGNCVFNLKTISLTLLSSETYIILASSYGWIGYIWFIEYHSLFCWENHWKTCAEPSEIATQSMHNINIYLIWIRAKEIN